MTARNSDIDASVMFDERNGVGVRASAASLLEYDLVVIARDAQELVGAAGGWLCDRVRAGWRVNAVLTDAVDVRPLQVLGVRAVHVDADCAALVRESPAALAISASILERDNALRADILRAVERGSAELTVWGQWQPGVLAGRVSPTHHRLSGAARAFKAQALVATGSPCTATESVEEFHSCALWYPPEGPDLMPVG